MQADDKFEIENIGIKRVLLVHDCRPVDEGLYEYQFEGSSTKATLVVDGKSVLYIYVIFVFV